MEELRHGGQQEAEEEVVGIPTPSPSSTSSSSSGRLQGPESEGQDTVARVESSSNGWKGVKEENQQVDTEVRFS